MKSSKYLFRVLCTLLLASCGAVDEDDNIFAAEGPASLPLAGGAFTKYTVGRQL